MAPKPPAIPASAKQIVTDFLNQYGLGSLANWAWNIYTAAGGGSTGIQAITAELPNTSQFKARFPAYETLAKEGRAMSIQQMLDYETQARAIFHAAGLPAGFYDQPQDFANFMLGNVSVSELGQRVQLAQQETMSYDPVVRSELQRLYGVDTGHLVAHALDPTQALPILERQATSAQIAAEAQRAQVGQLNVGQAENLTELGVSQQQAQAGFQNLGQERGLFEAQTQGENTIGLGEQIGAQFGGNTTAQLAFLQRQAQRKAAFNESSGFNVGQAGVGGLAPAQRGA